jgi:hypothetical protein
MEFRNNFQLKISLKTITEKRHLLMTLNSNLFTLKPNEKVSCCGGEKFSEQRKKKTLSIRKVFLLSPPEDIFHENLATFPFFFTLAIPPTNNF